VSVNLLAICRPTDDFVLKRVKVTSDVQKLLEGVFVSQEAEFLSGVDSEIAFDGGWKPDKNELLVAPSTESIAAIWTGATGNVIALDELDSANFGNEGIKALAVLIGQGDGRRLLLQNFSARQILDRRIAFVWDGETFNRLTAPSFSIGTALSGILTEHQVKFKSFSNIKMIFDLANLYQEATNAQIDDFSTHASISIADVEAFKGVADQTIRKLVNAVAAKGVLDTYDVSAIQTAAVAQSFDLHVDAGKIVFPGDRAGAKRLMHFLDEGFYRGPLSGDAYITNSKRKAT
jgi:hypothetical protein